MTYGVQLEVFYRTLLRGLWGKTRQARVFACVSVRVYVYVYVCVYVYVYVCVCVRVYVCMNVCMNVCVCLCRHGPRVYTDRGIIPASLRTPIYPLGHFHPLGFIFM